MKILNLENGFLEDLINNKPFKKKDVIILQDPKDYTKKNLKEFHFFKNKIEIPRISKKQKKINFINISHFGKKILEKEKNKNFEDDFEFYNKKVKKNFLLKKLTKKDIEKKIDFDEFLEERELLKDWKKKENSENESKSLTSTIFKSEKNILSIFNKKEMIKILFNTIKSKQIKSFGYFNTKIGMLKIEFFTHKTPRSCFSFFSKFKKKNYPNFFLNLKVKNNLLIDEKNSEIFDFIDQNLKYKHNQKGLLTINKSGKFETFSITLCENFSLNESNTIFGKIIEIDFLDLFLNGDENEVILDNLVLTGNAFDFIANAKRLELFEENN